jgi:hypothetical protein
MTVDSKIAKTEFWMRKTPEGVDIYIDTPGISLLKVLFWMSASDIPCFQTLGGEDCNGSSVQHRTFTKDKGRLRSRNYKNVVAPLSIMLADHTCSSLSSYLGSEPDFTPLNYDFDIEGVVRCYSSGKDNVLMQITSAGHEIITRILENQPSFKSFFDTAEKHQESFLVFAGNKIQVIFPGVYDVDEFKQQTFGDLIEFMLLANE